MDKLKFIIATDNGTELFENDMSNHLTDYATRKGLLYRVFVVKTKDNYMSYVIYDNDGLPQFESQKAEDIAVHFDMLQLIRDF